MNSMRAVVHLFSEENRLEINLDLWNQRRRVKNESLENLIRIYRWLEQALTMAALSYWPFGYCSAINDYENLP